MTCQPDASMVLTIEFENRPDEAERLAVVLAGFHAESSKVTKDAAKNDDGTEKTARTVRASFKGVTETLLDDIARALALTDDSEDAPLFEAQG